MLPLLLLLCFLSLWYTLRLFVTAVLVIVTFCCCCLCCSFFPLLSILSLLIFCHCGRSCDCSGSYCQSFDYGYAVVATATICFRCCHRCLFVVVLNLLAVFVFTVVTAVLALVAHGCVAVIVLTVLVFVCYRLDIFFRWFWCCRCDVWRCCRCCGCCLLPLLRLLRLLLTAVSALVTLRTVVAVPAVLVCVSVCM